MRRSKNQEKNNNLRLGIYFGLLVGFIIVVSVFSKVFDVVKRSRYDGENRFTVAVFSQNKTQAKVVSVSPRDGTLSLLTLTGTGSIDTLREAGVPLDGQVNSKEELIFDSKSVFIKILLNSGKFRSDLTIIDLVRLALFSQNKSKDQISEKSISIKDYPELARTVGTWFVDPALLEENQNIQITNTTGVSGLGNKFAKEITNRGGNVVLVNTSQDLLERSVIFYEKESYTAEKLSKMLGIHKEPKEMNSISDIVIIIGKDKENF